MIQLPLNTLAEPVASRQGDHEDQPQPVLPMTTGLRLRVAIIRFFLLSMALAVSAAGLVERDRGLPITDPEGSKWLT
jgi:hypothetical protein